jgi:hypothetical protein
MSMMALANTKNQQFLFSVWGICGLTEGRIKKVEEKVE